MDTAKKKQTLLIVGLVASAVILVLSTVFLIVVLNMGEDGTTEVVPGQTITPGDSEDPSSESLRFHYRTPDHNRAFAVTNMLPGDSVSADYSLNVAHKADLELYFSMLTDKEYLLSQVLMIRVEDLNSTDAEPLYEGLIKDMPEKLTVSSLSATEHTDSKIDFRVTAYLDTSVGNEYQATDLKATMSWWVENTDALSYPYDGVTDDSLIFIPGEDIPLWLVILLSLAMGLSIAGIAVTAINLKRLGTVKPSDLE